jgi:spermidine synthase
LPTFPDPDSEAVARLYSTVFYGWLARLLAPHGLFVTQASSPFFAPDAFFCIGRTLAEVGFASRPYVVDVPSFGPWGFHLAARERCA